MGMHGIEEGQNLAALWNMRLYGRDCLWLNGRAFYHANARRHAVRLNRVAVMSPDVDINAHHSSFWGGRVKRFAIADGVVVVQHRQNRGRQNQRSAVGDSRLNHYIGAHPPNQFLHGDHVLRVLDDWPS